MDKLKLCPLCAEELIVREVLFRDESSPLISAYCHCGFTFSADVAMDEFVTLCNRRAMPESCEGWIAIKDRLPEDHQTCLCFNGFWHIHTFRTRWDGNGDQAITDNAFWNFDNEWGYYLVDDITHWKPLDEPRED